MRTESARPSQTHIDVATSSALFAWRCRRYSRRHS